MLDVLGGRLYASGVMIILAVPAMTPAVVRVGGRAGIAANAGEHVY